MRIPKSWVVLWAFAGGILLIPLAWSGEESAMGKDSEKVVRKVHGAGRWYPGKKSELKDMVQGYIKAAKAFQVPGVIVGAIAPHAGYVYSGGIAGYTFRAIRDHAAAGHKPDTVVVLGLSHRAGFSGVALMDGDAIQTPLGEAPLDRESAQALTAASPRVFFDYTPHRGEHSAENEIPFVQAALPGVALVVGIMGDHDPRTIDDLVQALTALAQEKQVLVIASTDMLHDPNYELVTDTDRKTLEKVAEMDHTGLEQSWGPSRQIFCGIGPVLVTMRYAASLGCKKGTVLAYCNSGDEFPESRGRWVVGYGAAVFAVPQ
ncbi:MAG: AmmeMemoRadiSam system protein B [Desulfatiglandaceae bacterium]